MPTYVSAKQGFSVIATAKSPNAPFEISVLSGVVTISMPTAGRYLFRMWFSESATDPTLMLVPPTTPGWRTNEAVTDADGTLTLTVSGVPGATYLWVVFLGAAGVSDLIT